MSVIAFNRAARPAKFDCILRESPFHRVGISEVPIESGANITDHAFVEPKRVRMEIADGNAAATFNELVRIMETRVPFTLVTGLYVYSNMLIASIEADRDAEFSRVLRARIDLQEAIIVETAYTASPASQGQPGGKNSTDAAGPSKGRAGDTTTADRATGTVVRGDAATTTVDWSDRGNLFR